MTCSCTQPVKRKKNIVKIFEERMKCHGPFYENAITAAKCLTFKGISLYRRNVKNDPPVCPNAFYNFLKMSIAKSLIDTEEADFPKWVAYWIVNSGQKM
jgi:hypothetical protein